MLKVYIVVYNVYEVYLNEIFIKLSNYQFVLYLFEFLINMLLNNGGLYTRYPIVARRAWPTGCIGYTEREVGSHYSGCQPTAHYYQELYNPRNPYLKFSLSSIRSY